VPDDGIDLATLFEVDTLPTKLVETTEEIKPDVDSKARKK
jgi:hypothetical protein